MAQDVPNLPTIGPDVVLTDPPIPVVLASLPNLSFASQDVTSTPSVPRHQEFSSIPVHTAPELSPAHAPSTVIQSSPPLPIKKRHSATRHTPPQIAAPKVQEQAAGTSTADLLAGGL